MNAEKSAGTWVKSSILWHQEDSLNVRYFVSFLLNKETNNKHIVIFLYFLCSDNIFNSGALLKAKLPWQLCLDTFDSTIHVMSCATVFQQIYKIGLRL